MAAADTQNPPALPPPPQEDPDEGNKLLVSEAIDRIGFGRFQIFMLFVCGAVWMLDAMEIMVLTFLSAGLRCDWGLSHIETAILTIIVFVGQGFGALFWGAIGDRFGRRSSYLGSALFVGITGLLSSFAPNLWVLLLFRFATGFGIGGASQSLAYFAEFLPARNRGFYMVCLQFSWSFGAIFEACLAFAVMPTLGWRWLMTFSSLPSLIVVCLFPLIPESPWYLLRTEQQERAQQLVKRVAKCNGRPSFQIPPGGLCLSRNEGDLAQAQGPMAFLKIVFGDTYRFTSILLITIWFSCAFMYYGLVLFTTELFLVEQEGLRCKSKGFVAPDGSKCTQLQTEDYFAVLITAAAEFFGILLALGGIETIGRRNTSKYMLLVASVGFLLLLPCTPRAAETSFIFLARGCITGGFQVIEVYTPEVYSTAIRARISGFFNFCARGGAILTPLIAQVVLRREPFIAIAIYAMIAVVAVIAAQWLPFETKGAELGSPKSRIAPKDPNPSSAAAAPVNPQKAAPEVPSSSSSAAAAASPQKGGRAAQYVMEIDDAGEGKEKGKASTSGVEPSISVAAARGGAGGGGKSGSISSSSSSSSSSADQRGGGK